MHIICAGLRFLVVGVTGVLLALAGVFLSVTSAAVGRAIPATDAATEQIQPKRLAAVTRHQHSHSRSRSVGSPESVPRSPRPNKNATSSASSPKEPQLPSTADQDNARRPLSPDRPPVRVIAHPVSIEVLQPTDSDELRSRRPLVLTAEKKKRPSRLHEASFVSAVPTLSPVLSSAVTNTPVLHEQTNGSDESDGSRRPGVARTASAPHGFVKRKASLLPRKQRSMPPQKQNAPARRTDPYGPPYFFPPPGSPQAVDYVRQVKLERISTRSPAGEVLFQQRVQCPKKGGANAPLEGSPPASSPTDEHVSPVSEEHSDPDFVPPESARTPTRRWSWNSPSSSSRALRMTPAAVEQTEESSPHHPVRRSSLAKFAPRKSRSSSVRPLTPSSPSVSRDANFRARPPSSAGSGSIPRETSAPAEPHPTAPQESSSAQKSSWRSRFGHRRKASANA